VSMAYIPRPAGPSNRARTMERASAKKLCVRVAIATDATVRSDIIGLDSPGEEESS